MISFKVEGLDDLQRELRQLPAAFAGEASNIVHGIANGAVVDMRAEYPPGELRDGLSQSTLASGPFGVGLLIKNRSGWAWHWDHGTRLRHTSGSGRRAHSTGAEWGGTRPPHTFGRTMSKARREMARQLWQLLERAGFQVSGGDGA